MANKFVHPYQGVAIEKGATSIKGRGASPAIKWLVKEGYIKKSMKVLDYGAGKFARNADYLRKLGCRVYAYDPYNYNTTGSGYTLGAVTKRKPRGSFNVALTSFVLNVVPLKAEQEIIAELQGYADTTFHNVRNESDLMTLACNALSYTTHNEFIRAWYRVHFGDRQQAYVNDVCLAGVRNTWLVKEFCYFGFQTGKDKFQRLVNRKTMHRRGYNHIKQTSGYCLYGNK